MKECVLMKKNHVQMIQMIQMNLTIESANLVSSPRN